MLLGSKLPLLCLPRVADDSAPRGPPCSPSRTSPGRMQSHTVGRAWAHLSHRGDDGDLEGHGAVGAHPVGVVAPWNLSPETGAVPSSDGLIHRPCDPQHRQRDIAAWSDVLDDMCVIEKHADVAAQLGHKLALQE